MPNTSGLLPWLLQQGQQQQQPVEDTIVPRQSSGMSDRVTVGGRTGRFNFDLPPDSDDRTPGLRHAYIADDGELYYYQIEKANYGGRWDDSANFDEDLENLRGMSEKVRRVRLGDMWPNENKLISALIGALAKNMPNDQIKKQLKPFNTYRQISNVEYDPLKGNPLDEPVK